MSRDIGQYKIFQEIGKGSFGKVYKGIDKISNQEVALKFIQKKQKRSRDLKNLREENQLLKKINHPNVISLKDVIQTSKQIIIVTDYAGRDLSGLIEQVKKFPLEKVKEYSVQILNAMLYLNESRIIHRDLKPQNILIKGNHIKICDFGFAKKLSASTNFLQSMKGTPLYLAPQIVRQTKYTEKVDIWSFGCIIYELFTGRTPYYANTYQKLAPLILYQQVQYPKQMPADLKDLISSMLQKNPSARPDWKQLKNHSFFKITQALKQKIENNQKQVVSIEVSQKSYMIENFLFCNEGKQNKILEDKQQITEYKIIQKIQNQNQLKNYPEEFKVIYSELTSNTVFGNELRHDIIFLHKMKAIYHERSSGNSLITDELLEVALNILDLLVRGKGKKIQLNDDGVNENSNIDEEDITKNDALIFGILCLAKVEKNYNLLDKELKVICRLVKNNFTRVAINTEVDEEITEFVTEILLQSSSNLPISCIKNGLIIIGTMVNQAMMTINNSYQYFERVAEDNLLSKIAKIYKKEQNYSTVLQCLKQFIHPTREVPSMTGNNPHNILHSKTQKIFLALKDQVADGLLKTDFLSQKSPFDVYKDNQTALISYCKVLLQCLSCSTEMRKQFLKYNYWNTLLNSQQLYPFFFAYNSIFIEQEGKSIIKNEEMCKFSQESRQNKLITVAILQMSDLKLRQKQQGAGKQKFRRTIIEQVHQILFIQEGAKQAFTKEVYGLFAGSSKKFDLPLIRIFYNIVTGVKVMDNAQENKQYIQMILIIFKRICSTVNSFKPCSSSLYKLMQLLSENQIIKTLKYQKSIQTFFYECISDFIKREDCDYLDNQLQQSQIPFFLAKITHTLNWLVEVEEAQNKVSSLPQAAINLIKDIQISGFYRVMLIDGLNEDHFYEHLKFNHRILSKTVQNVPEFTNFLGVKVISMCKNYIKTSQQPLLLEIFLFISQISRQHTQFNSQIVQSGVIKRLSLCLTDNCSSESIKQKALYLVGNLAKKSDYFFCQFQTHSVVEAISFCLKTFHHNIKILKNSIYSIGNISFYSQKFYKEIQPMIPYFAKAFETNDPHLKSNLISTVCNLIRFSNVYLLQLIKAGLIDNILKIGCQSNQIDQTVANLVLSLIKKILPYDEFYQSFGTKELKILYQKRSLFGGDSNDVIKKIKEFLMAHSAFD